MSAAKRMVSMAILVALALILSIVERAIPMAALMPGLAPGVKLGLANIVTLSSLFILPWPEVLIVIVVRVTLSAALGGGFSAFLFSLSGALLAWAAMSPLIYRAGKYLSLPAISVIGALAHNLGQLLVAGLLTHTLAIVYYLPVMVVAAAATGLIVGVTTNLLLRALSRGGQIRQTERLSAFVKAGE
ncbi:MAG: Gx transporter family protein [Chloroflexota bacterium]